MKAVFLVCLCTLTCLPLAAREKAKNTYSIPTPPQTNFSPLDWLIGEWAGKTVGRKPSGQVLFSASYELGHRFMVLREEISLPATKSAPATHEGVMGILSGNPSGNGFDLVLYSSYGFITHYQVIASGNEVDFNPSGGPLLPQGWLFRWVIKNTHGGECVESVQVAPPGESFFNYYTAQLSQLTPGAPTTSAPAGSRSKRFSFWHLRHRRSHGTGGGN